MDKFDREKQKKILQKLYDLTPFIMDDEEYEEFCLLFEDENTFLANLLYLEGHGLIESGVTLSNNEADINLSKLSLTHKGIDFIRDDGGLGAILNVLTIRLHAETLDEFERIIKDSKSATPEEKKKLLTQLRALPADAIKHLTLQLLGKGMEHLPDAFHTIQTALRHL
ncbi:TPA: hypothetical protein ACF7ZB_001855 [Kluyvera georgiana]